MMAAPPVNTLTAPTASNMFISGSLAPLSLPAPANLPLQTPPSQMVQIPKKSHSNINVESSHNTNGTNNNLPRDSIKLRSYILPSPQTISSISSSAPSPPLSLPLIAPTNTNMGSNKMNLPKSPWLLPPTSFKTLPIINISHPASPPSSLSPPQSSLTPPLATQPSIALSALPEQLPLPLLHPPDSEQMQKPHD